MLQFLVFSLLVARLAASTPEFEPNLGQVESRYLFLTRAENIRAYIEDRGLLLSASDGTSVRMSWVDASGSRAGDARNWTVLEPTGNVFYYCKHSTAALCSQEVRSYRRLVRRELCKGVSWVLHGRENKLEYDLVISPGVSIKDIRLRVEGVPGNGRSILERNDD